MQSIKPSSHLCHSAWPDHLRRPRLHGLYVITEEGVPSSFGQHYREADDAETWHEQIVRAAIAGGAALIQLRDKSTSLPQLYTVAQRLRRLTASAGVLFLINDRPDLALACDADGVHLGPDDLPIEAARRVLGPHRLIGVSCSDAAQARQAERDGADYIGAGAIFSTATKADAGAPIGLERLREIISATRLPVAAIGGINATNIAQVAAQGARMACVVSAVTRAGNATQMTQATRDLAQRFESGKEFSSPRNA
jgi:thiamine-phosphate diphosphorylase